MEISVETIMSVVGLLLGGGGIGTFITWRYQKRKEKAEVSSQEAGAAQSWQDVYQQLINDIKTDRDEQKVYINELKDDRRHLREENGDLRKRQDDLDEKVRKLQQDVSKNRILVENMRPFLCRRDSCMLRIPVTISDEGVVEQPTPQEPEEIAPYDEH